MLVVDDKKIIGDLFGFILGCNGHLIDVVRSSEEALDKIRVEDYDLIFLDIVLPGIDGVEILKQIKTIKKDVPVVMMSGYAVEEKRIQVEKLGAFTTLEKPFEMDDVRKVVRDAIGKEI